MIASPTNHEVTHPVEQSSHDHHGHRSSFVPGSLYDCLTHRAFHVSLRLIPIHEATARRPHNESVFSVLLYCTTQCSSFISLLSEPLPYYPNFDTQSPLGIESLTSRLVSSIAISPEDDVNPDIASPSTGPRFNIRIQRSIA